MPPPAGSIPNTPSWRDKMGQYPQGTLALEGFGSGAGHGVTIVDANTGQALTRIGDPGWNDIDALQRAGYAHFVDDVGKLGTMADFARKLTFTAGAIETQNREGSTGIGGTNTLRNIASGVLGAALPAFGPGILSSLQGATPAFETFTGAPYASDVA